MKNTLEGFKTRFAGAEERISHFKDKTIKIIKSEEQHKQMVLK